MTIAVFSRLKNFGNHASLHGFLKRTFCRLKLGWTFVYIYDTPMFRKCDVTDNAYCGGFSLDRSSDTLYGLHEFKLIFSILYKFL